MFPRRFSRICGTVQKRCIPVNSADQSVSWPGEKISKRRVATDVRPYDEIPQVKGLPFIGTLLDYTPLRRFRYSHIFDLWRKRHETYGEIYRERILNSEAVYFQSPANLEKLFRSEGRFPERPFLKGIAISNEAMGLPTSILNLVGQDWYELRHPLNELLMKNKMVWRYVNEMHEITKELADVIRRKRNEKGEVPDFDGWMNRWTFEMAGTFSFNKRMGLLRDDAPSDIIEAFEGTKLVLGIVANLLFGGQYRVTKEFTEGVRRSHDVFSKLIMEQELHSEDFNSSVLGGIMRREELSDQQKFSLVLDLVLASVETTARTTELILYCLTIDPMVQEKLREEVLSLFPDRDEKISGRAVNGMKYVNAFLKEVHRLYPITHSASRVMTDDVVFSGYRVPAGTTVHVTTNSTQNKNPELFEEPEKFSPGRWLDRGNAVSKFSTTTPFGLGPRACPGRHFAMQEIHLVLIEILRNFRVEYKYEPMISIMQGSGALSGKPKFSFVDL